MSIFTQVHSSIKKLGEKYIPHFLINKIVVGLSGGSDSIALAHALKQIKCPIIAVYIKYHKDNVESIRETDLVNYFCNSMAIPLKIITVPMYNGNGNFQNWARKVRYQHLYSYSLPIAVAHHSDDQWETILMKILMGKSPNSFSGLSYYTPPIFRPLLDFSKNDILNYLDYYSLPYYTDQSNLRNIYARNYLRNQATSKFDHFFPGWKTNLISLAEWGKNYSFLINYITTDIVISDNIYDYHKLCQFPPHICFSILHSLIKKKNIDTSIFLSKSFMNNIKCLYTLQTGKKISIGSNYFLLRDRNLLHLISKKALEPLPSVHIMIDQTFSEHIIPTLGIRIELKEKIPTSINKVPHSLKPIIIKIGMLKFPLSIRTWEKGDYVTFSGNNKKQKISNLLTNEKVSTLHRKNVLVCNDSNGTIFCIIFIPFTRYEKKVRYFYPAYLYSLNEKILILTCIS